MSEIEKINFRQSRDFGETFNIAIKFLRQNFKLFFKSILFIAGPFILLSAIAYAFYASNTVSFSALTIGRNLTSPLAKINSLIGPLSLFLLSSILSGITMTGTTYSFMLLYLDKGPGAFTVNDVAQLFIKNIGKLLSVFFVLLLVAIIFIVVFGGIMIGLTAAIPALAVLFILAIIIGLMIIGPPLMWQMSATYLVKMTEQKSVLESFGHTRKVMRDNFWWTWVLVFCTFIVIGLAGFVFALPQAIYQIVLMFSHLKGGSSETSYTFLIVSTLCTFCKTLLYSVMYLINGFHFYSLAEKTDGIGLMERINEIGTTPTDNVNQQY